MRLTNILFTLLLASLERMVAADDDEDILDLDVCPKSHPFAFQFGQACCSEQGGLDQWTQTFCNGEGIYCDGPSCEDFRTCSLGCGEFFPTCWSKATLRIHNLSPDYDGDYSYSELPSNKFILEGNRPVFQGENELKEKCIWWHHEYRHWWIGPCDSIGLNAGFAYIQEDIGCPVECKTETDDDGMDYCSSQIPMTWRRGGSDEVIYDVKLQRDFSSVASAGGSATTNTTSFVGINAIIQDSTSYKQSCRFRLINGRFVCVKKNGSTQN